MKNISSKDKQMIRTLKDKVSYYQSKYINDYKAYYYSFLNFIEKHNAFEVMDLNQIHSFMESHQHDDVYVDYHILFINYSRMITSRLSFERSIRDFFNYSLIVHDDIEFGGLIITDKRGVKVDKKWCKSLRREFRPSKI